MKSHSILSLSFVALVFALAVHAGEPPWPFEGHWMESDACDLPIEYTTEHRRDITIPCSYEKVEQVDVNRWEVEAECLISFNEEDEDGDTLRRNRDSTTRIELTLDGDRLIERLTFDIDNRPEFPTREPFVSEYFRCETPP